MLTLDNEILKNHKPEVKTRARMELAICRKLLELAGRFGYTLEEEEYGREGDLLKLLFNLDEARLSVKSNGKHIGGIFLVFGNGGYDLISDYSTSLEDFLSECFALSKHMEENGGV